MSFNRPLVKAEDGGLAIPARLGSGWLAMPNPVTQATDANIALPVASILGGLYVRNGMSAGRSDTIDTAANILAAMPSMDIGDNFVFAVSVGTAFVWTLVTAAGVTLAGKTTVPASGFGFFLVTKTSATTVTITGL